ncbi:MAG: hypothetical protein KUF74_03835 [Candidatus Thiodiazotropha sp. (ex Ctena orbiculata)]|nr:hypothetical protein [Candidatus Thiodiazotropha taylori]
MPIPFETELLPQAQWAEPIIELRQDQEVFPYSLAATIAYHGLDSIGGVVLGFRLLQAALQNSSHTQPVERQSISILSAFPGAGARDAFEYLSRCVSQQRFQCDTSLSHPKAQKGFEGCFYFKITLAGEVLELSPIEGQPPETFFSAGRQAFKSEASDAERLLWRQEKIQLANTLLGLPANQCIRLLKS